MKELEEEEDEEDSHLCLHFLQLMISSSPEITQIRFRFFHYMEKRTSCAVEIGGGDKKRCTY